MSRSLIVYAGNDPEYLAIVWQLAQDVLDASDIPVLLDLSSVSAGVGDSYNRRVLGASRLRSPDALFRQIVMAAGWDILDAKDTLKLLAKHEMEVLPSGVAAIEEGTKSALISYSRDPIPPSGRMWERMRAMLTKSGRDISCIVMKTLADRTDIDFVYVANGRFPGQRAALQAASDSGRRTLYYEKGEKPGSYWLDDHSNLDRIATQANIDRVLGALPSGEAISIGRAWMNDRSSGSGGANLYARFFRATGLPQSENESSDQRRVGIFTSSQDEFESLGADWHLQDWADQWDAFDHVLTYLEARGYSFYLRIHPNFASKSHASFLREKARAIALRIKHPSLRIIWHDEQVSSYELLAETNVVVVWNSTIALEASGRGVASWELAPSYYDLYSDVRMWFGTNSDPKTNEFEFEVDVERSERFMAYISIRDHPMSESALLVRESVMPRNRLGYRVAAFVSSGGAPTTRIALKAMLDSVRHRSFDINRMAIGRFFFRP